MLTKLGSSTWIALENLKEDARGVSAVEYAILAAVIIVIVVAGVQLLGISIEDLFRRSSDAVRQAAPAAP